MRFTDYMKNSVNAVGIDVFCKNYGFRISTIQRYMDDGCLFEVTRGFISLKTQIPITMIAK